MCDLDLGRVRDQQARGEIGEERALRGGIGTRRFEEQLNGDLQSLQRIGLAGGRGADLIGGPAERVLEKREQKLVLAIELQVKAAQRLARTVDDLLDREVRAALFDDDGLCGIQEALHALSGP